MYIDSHCHLDFPEFDEDRAELIVKAQRQGVSDFIVPGTQFHLWDKQRLLKEKFSCLHMAYGLHPYFLETATVISIDQLGDVCEAGNALAVGEIGLDIWPGAVDLTVQINFFVRQMAVAKALRLPVILHARKSYDQIFKLLKQMAFPYGGIVHGFSGSLVQAKRFLDMGFVLGIGGNITYARAIKSRKVLASLEDKDFVLETDSPDMPLSGQQGCRNEPIQVVAITKVIADIRDQSECDIAEYTSENVHRVFPRYF